MGAAVAPLGSFHTDATDLKVRDGTPFIRVRFTVPAASEREEDAAAQGVARRMRGAVDPRRHHRSAPAAAAPWRGLGANQLTLVLGARETVSLDHDDHSGGSRLHGDGQGDRNA